MLVLDVLAYSLAVNEIFLELYGAMSLVFAQSVLLLLGLEALLKPFLSP